MDKSSSDIFMGEERVGWLTRFGFRESDARDELDAKI